jgi:hypothetical protein
VKQRIDNPTLDQIRVGDIATGVLRGAPVTAAIADCGFLHFAGWKVEYLLDPTRENARAFHLDYIEREVPDLPTEPLSVIRDVQTPTHLHDDGYLYSFGVRARSGWVIFADEGTYFIREPEEILAWTPARIAPC